MELSNASKMKQADETAIRERGIDSLRLMETAAGFVAEAAADYLGENSLAVVFCGPGNNGGDGVAAARLLMQRWLGTDVRVFLVGKRDRMTPDCLAMEKRLEEAGGVLEDFSPEDDALPALLERADVIVDALFGVGLSRPVKGDALTAVQLINQSERPVVAADIASGVSADTGAVMGEAVFATRTVTFSKAKPGHFVEPGCVHCGKLDIKDIGIPRDLVEKSGCGIFTVNSEDLRLPIRNPVSHKGDYGKLLVIGGSIPYTGAPSLCARAAVRAGAGLVYLGVPADIYTITAVKNEEVMPFPFAPDETAWTDIEERLAGCDVSVVGPGLGRSEAVCRLVEQVLQRTEKPVVADADALWVISQNIPLLDNADGPVVVTPHEGEFARLLGRPVEDRLTDALAFSSAHGCAVVLKGHRTICAFPDGKAYIITAGNPGMAKGGSGDVLAGTIGALIGQLPFETAIVTACWIHARAGDIAAELYGEYALRATDIIELLYRAEMEII